MIRKLVTALVLCVALSGPAAALADRGQDSSADTPESERGTEFRPVTGAQREHIPGGTMVVIAYAVVWGAVFAYVGMQWLRQARVRDELAHMEKALEEERKAG